MSSTDGAALLGAGPFDSDVDALVKLDMSAAIGADFVPMANDIVRMVCIQAAIQMMLVLSSGGERGIAFFSAEFLLLVFYIALGVMLYWLAVRKLLLFV